MTSFNIIKSDQGYYTTEKIDFEDYHANHLEKGFVRQFLLFINEREFLCTGWKNKEALLKEDVRTIRRGGKYTLEGDKITLVYNPSGWQEECTIIDSHKLLHPFREPAIPMYFTAW